MSKTVKAAGVQLAPEADRAKTLTCAANLISVAARKGAQIVCLPQLFHAPWFPAKIDNAGFEFAETEDGPSVTAVREAAVKNKVTIIAPVFEKDEESDGDYFNTAFVIGPDGETLGRYRKIHIPQIPLWEERTYFKPGDLGFPVIVTPVAKIGIQLCWDVFYPEGARLLALGGAEIIFAPTASAFAHSRPKWERAIAATAHANGLFMFRVNRVGGEEKQKFYGGSFCVRPDGDYLIKPAGETEGIVLAEMNLHDVSEARNVWEFLKGRRPETYKGIA